MAGGWRDQAYRQAGRQAEVGGQEGKGREGKEGKETIGSIAVSESAPPSPLCPACPHLPLSRISLCWLQRYHPFQPLIPALHSSPFQHLFYISHSFPFPLFPLHYPFHAPFIYTTLPQYCFFFPFLLFRATPTQR